MRLRTLLSVLGAALLCGGAGAAFESPRQIVVVSDENYPPYLFRDSSGRLQGILRDKWDLWSARTGVGVRLEGSAWADAQKSVLAGGADVIEALAFNEERAKLYEYSQPYATAEARVFFHNSLSGINDVGSLRGFTVGAKDGSACAAWLAQRGVDTVRRYPSSDDVVRALEEGEVRLFCMDSPVAHYFLLRNGLADRFRQTPPLYVTNFHWATRKGRAELRDFIAAGFERISAGELKAIEERWSGAPLSGFHFDSRYFYYAAGAAALFLLGAALLAFWNRGLSLRVARRTAELSAAMREVETNAERVRDLYNKAPCGYHSLDADAVVIDINDTELHWLGHTRDEVVGRMRFADFLTAEGKALFAERFPRFKAMGPLNPVEYELVRKDGSTMWVSLQASPIRDADGRYVSSRVTVYDIAERKRAEHEVLRLNAELEARIAERTRELSVALRDLEAFNYTVSHDLRAPLRNISAFVELAQRDIAQGVAPRAVDRLERAHRAAKRLDTMIRALLELSREERVPLRLEPVRANEVAGEVMAEVRAQLNGRRIEWRAAALEPCLADRALLRNVLTNLLDNAVKFTRDRDPAVIELAQVEKANGAVSFSLRDNGVGFDMEYADKLFGVFSRIHSEAEFEGTGVGLASCRRLLERMGGSIRAEATLGRGAAFFVTLPAA